MTKGISTDYEATAIQGDDHEQVAAATDRELQKIEAALGAGKARILEVRNVVPAKPREGLITMADGVNWNPGFGKGPYVYSGGLWIPAAVLDGSVTYAKLSAGAKLAVQRRNALINGDMGIWQRGGAFGAATGYTADRWQYAQALVGGVVTISRSTDVPTVAQVGRLFSSSFNIQVTTIDAAIAAGDLYLLQQVIEGSNFAPFAQQPCNFSFWVKAKKTGINCVSFRNQAVSDRSYVAEYTINASDTWEFKTIPVLASPAAGTWNYGSGQGLFVVFTFAAGGTFQTGAGAWQNGNFFATANQINNYDNVANYIRITGAQFELGSEATAFEYRSWQEAYNDCQRYYKKSYVYPVAPANVASGIQYQATGAGGEAAPTILWDIEMRVTPTANIYSPVTAANGFRRNYSTGADEGMAGFNVLDAKHLSGSTTAHAAGQIYGYHYTMDAEL